MNMRCLHQCGHLVDSKLAYISRIIWTWGAEPMESLTNIVVSESEITNVTRVLGRLILDTGASHVLLLDKSGQLILSQGPTGQRDIIALSALLAGAFASSRHVAEILGERDFRSILQQGVQE